MGRLLYRPMIFFIMKAKYLPTMGQRVNADVCF